MLTEIKLNNCITIRGSFVGTRQDTEGGNIISLQTNRSAAEVTPSKPANVKHGDLTSASVPDNLAALHVNPDIGLMHSEVDVRRKEHGYNEVAEAKERPVLKFLR
jgi:hypothetical protein